MSIAEVLASTTVFVVILLGVAHLFIVATHSNAISADITTSTYLADNELEEYRAQDYDSLSEGTTQAELGVRSMVYDRSTSVTEDSPLPGVKTIEVEVVPRRSGEEKSRGTVTLTAFAYKSPDLPNAPASPGSVASPASPYSAPPPAST